MSGDREWQHGDGELSSRIFGVSASMVGVCLTVISLFQLTPRLSRVGAWADRLVAIDASAFVLACLFSYVTLKSRRPTRRARMEQLADATFLIALLLMVSVGVVVACELI